MLGKDLGWFDMPEHSTGVLTAKLATEVRINFPDRLDWFPFQATLVEGMVGTRLAVHVMNTVTIISGLIIAFFYGWKLTLVILAVSPLLIFANMMDMASVKGYSRKNAKALANANQVCLLRKFSWRVNYKVTPFVFCDVLNISLGCYGMHWQYSHHLFFYQWRKSVHKFRTQTRKTRQSRNPNSPHTRCFIRPRWILFAFN